MSLYCSLNLCTFLKNYIIRVKKEGYSLIYEILSFDIILTLKRNIGIDRSYPVWSPKCCREIQSEEVSPCTLGEIPTWKRSLDSDQERMHEQVEQVQAHNSLIKLKHTLKEGMWAYLRDEQSRRVHVGWSYSWSSGVWWNIIRIGGAFSE